MTTPSKARGGVRTRDAETLVREYLAVCNTAIERHADEKILGAIIDAANRLVDGKRLGVEIYDGDPERTYAYCTITWRDGGPRFVARGKQDPDLAVKVDRAYLEKVVSDPDPYLDNPARLDLEWLTSRLGLTTRAERQKRAPKPKRGSKQK